MIHLLCQGPLDWTLGCEYVLLALRGLFDAGIGTRLVIAGDGPERDRVLYTIADLALGDAVSLVPGATDSSRLAVECDALILTPLGDGPRREIEAARSAGVPVVVSDRAGLRDAVADGKSGLVVGARDSAALQAALARLVADPALCEQLAAGAREAGR